MPASTAAAPTAAAPTAPVPTETIAEPASRRVTVSPTLSRTLDVLRGAAALIVVMQHARTYLFADLELLQPQSLGVRAVYFVTGFGHAAVMVFFVLSGFLVGGSALTAIEEGRFSWRRYLLQRGTRLWIVLFPALVLTALWDHAGVLFTAHPATLAAHLRTNAIPGYPWTVEGHGIVAFVGNALFLMNLVVPTFGSNGALWSLGCEVTYYVLFPLAVIAVIDRRDVRRALVAFALFALLAWAADRKILEWGVMWLMGVVVARAPRIALSRRASTVLASAFGVVLVAVMAYHRATTNDITFARDAVVSALCAVVVYALRCIPHDAREETTAPSWVTRPFLTAAGFAYTLYLVHEPPLAFLREWIVARPRHQWTPSPAHLAAALAIVVALYAYAYVLSLVTEAQTDRVRAWLQHRLGAWHPSLAPAARAAHRLAEVATEVATEATEGIAPAPTWQTTAES